MPLDPAVSPRIVAPARRSWDSQKSLAAVLPLPLPHESVPRLAWLTKNGPPAQKSYPPLPPARPSIPHSRSPPASLPSASAAPHTPSIPADLPVLATSPDPPSRSPSSATSPSPPNNPAPYT